MNGQVAVCPDLNEFTSELDPPTVDCWDKDVALLASESAGRPQWLHGRSHEEGKCDVQMRGLCGRDDAGLDRISEKLGRTHDQ